MNVVIWIAQIALAAVFLMAGVLKLITPMDELIANGLLWVETTGPVLTTLIGVAEVTAAIGLIFPSLLRVRPKLSALAAEGLVVLMLGAIATHIYRGEYGVIPIPAVLGAVAAFVAWGRFKAHPIEPKETQRETGSAGRQSTV